MRNLSQGFRLELRKVVMSRTTNRAEQTDTCYPSMDGASQKLSDADWQALSDELMNYRCGVWEVIARTTWSHISADLQSLTGLPGRPAGASDCVDKENRT